jgi:hypothetical protein
MPVLDPKQPPLPVGVQSGVAVAAATGAVAEGQAPLAGGKGESALTLNAVTVQRRRQRQRLALFQAPVARRTTAGRDMAAAVAVMPGAWVLQT